jgi:hypothetical protein
MPAGEGIPDPDYRQLMKGEKFGFYDNIREK